LFSNIASRFFCDESWLPEILKARGLMKTIAMSAAVLISLCSSNLHAQSEGASYASQLSLAPSVEIGSVAMQSLKDGGKFSVKAIKHVGEVVEIVVESAIDGTQFVIRSSAKLIRGTAITTGVAVSVVAVSAGFVLYASGQAIAFVADERTREHSYSRQCS
jgi:hypothetical protein